MNLEQTGKDLKVPRKPHHRTKSLDSDSLSMEWSIVHGPGIGLKNQNEAQQSLNICYINGVLQCLAHAPPFSQWLLNEDIHEECKLYDPIGVEFLGRSMYVLL